MLSSGAETRIVFADTLSFPKENLSMADALLPTEGETQSPVAGAKKSAATRSLFDTQALKQLALTEYVAHAAQRPECVAPLAAEEITAVFVAQLLTDTQTTQAKFARIITLHGNTRGATATESTHHTSLLQQLTGLNSAALRKWGNTPAHKGDRDTYGIGKKLKDFSRPALETLVTGILQRVAADNLPGVTPTKIQALQATFTAWKTADQEQTTHATDATQLLTEAKAELESLNTRRRNIQLAADTIWPASDSNNAPIRTAFGLPKTRPFRV